MSEIRGAAQQLRGAQAVAQTGQQQQQVREVREDRAEQRTEQREEVRREREVRVEEQQGARAARVYQLRIAASTRPCTSMFCTGV